MIKFNVVTGLRRSGTSMMMLMLRQSGIPIVGFKFPVTINPENNDIVSCIPSRHVRDGNPNGFWEMGGITTQKGLSLEFMDIGSDKDTVKIDAGALVKSDPRMIGRAIVMLRNPKKILASMIKGQLLIAEDMETALMHMTGSLKELRNYLHEHKIEYLAIDYDRVLETPRIICRNAVQFLGERSFEDGANIVTNTLSRSKECEEDFRNMAGLEDIYKKFTRI